MVRDHSEVARMRVILAITEGEPKRTLRFLLVGSPRFELESLAPEARRIGQATPRPPLIYVSNLKFAVSV